MAIPRHRLARRRSPTQKRKAPAEADAIEFMVEIRGFEPLTS
jgi:hypothetical protein